MYNDKHKEMLGKMHILLVDDDLQLRNVIRVTLESVGYVCSEAGDGQEARCFLEGGQGVGLIVTDHQMPQMTGLDLLRWVRSNASTSHVPVLLYSGNLTEELRKLAQEAGVHAVLAKPFPLEDLLSLVSQLTSCSH